jgi:hypothetical protein
MIIQNLKNQHFIFLRFFRYPSLSKMDNEKNA